MSTASMTIDGCAHDAEATFAVVDPATQEACGAAPACSPAKLDAAVGAAARAQAAWGEASAQDARRAALREAAGRVEAAADELASLVTAEQGKPLASARSEAGATAYWLQAVASLPLAAEQPADGIRVERRPLGVVAAITPWNYPLLLASWKLAPALLAGNAVVLKPSPYTPLATLRMGELLRDAFPPGVLNVVSGGDELGAALVAHAGVRKVSFTGSTAAGRAIARAAAPAFKRVTLELGGNDAAIVLPDADPAAVAADLFWAAFENCGQICAAVKRLYVPRSRAGELTDALVAIAQDVTVGPGAAPGVRLGPLTTRAQFTRVRELVDEAIDGGARAVAGGDALPGPGNFLEPTLLTGAADDARVVAEEQFGPVLPILVYDDLDDAVARANATPFGLCGSVWGEDLDLAADVAARLECGSAYVNSHGGVAPDLPFGGVKDSGLGVEHGREGLDAYCDVRVTAIRGPGLA